MNAIEIIYEGFMEQEQDIDTKEVREASAIIEEQLIRLLPLDKAERFYGDILSMVSASQKQGFVEGFRLAVRMMKDCG
jgi:hypothetical protein